MMLEKAEDALGNARVAYGNADSGRAKFWLYQAAIYAIMAIAEALKK